VAKNILEVISLSSNKDTSSFKVQIPKSRNHVAIEKVKMVQKDHMVPVRFPTKRRNAGKHFFNALLEGELNITQGDIG